MTATATDLDAGLDLPAEFCVAEFAAAVGLSPEAGKRLIGEAGELRYRLPGLWSRVTSGDVQAWRARKVAQPTIGLCPEAAAFVDCQIAPRAHRVGPIVLERLVEEATARLMPEEAAETAEAAAERRHATFHDQPHAFAGTMEITAELDLADALDLQSAIAAEAAQRRLLSSGDSLDVRRPQALGDLARRPPVLDFDSAEQGGDAEAEVGVPRVPARQVILYVHLSEAALIGLDPVARLERGNTLINVDQGTHWCTRPDTARVVVKLILDLPSTHAHAEAPPMPHPPDGHHHARDKPRGIPWPTPPPVTRDT